MEQGAPGNYRLTPQHTRAGMLQTLEIDAKCLSRLHRRTVLRTDNEP
jgi:hypothetical protein